MAGKEVIIDNLRAVLEGMGEGLIIGLIIVFFVLIGLAIYWLMNR